MQPPLAPHTRGHLPIPSHGGNPGSLPVPAPGQSPLLPTFSPQHVPFPDTTTLRPLHLAPLRELEIPSFSGNPSDFEDWFATFEAVLWEPYWDNILLHPYTTEYNQSLSRSLWVRLQNMCAPKAKNRLLYIEGLQQRRVKWLAALHTSYNPPLPSAAAYALLASLTQAKRKNNETIETFALRLQRDHLQVLRSGIPDLSEDWIVDIFLNSLVLKFQHLQQQRLFATGGQEWSQLTLEQCVEKTKMIKTVLVVTSPPAPAPAPAPAPDPNLDRQGGRRNGRNGGRPRGGGATPAGGEPNDRNGAGAQRSRQRDIDFAQIPALMDRWRDGYWYHECSTHRSSECRHFRAWAEYHNADPINPATRAPPQQAAQPPHQPRAWGQAPAPAPANPQAPADRQVQAAPVKVQGPPPQLSQTDHR